LARLRPHWFCPYRLPFDFQKKGVVLRDARINTRKKCALRAARPSLTHFFSRAEPC
jgi:ribosomal protein S9